MILLSIDPGRSAKGEASIGYALFSGGEELDRGRITYEMLTTIMEYLATGSVGRFPGYLSYVDEVVIEDFVNNDKSRGGQTNGTSECIGMVEFAAGLLGIPFTRQPPAALGPAKLHAPAGSYKPLKHLRHEDSAFLHGYEYLVRKGVISVDLSDTMPL